MHKVLLLTVVLLLGATMAVAQFPQNGTIGIFSDPTGTSCNLPGPAEPGFPAGWLFVYFLHVNATGATVSQWAAPAPACFPAVRVGDILVDPSYLYMGDTATGMVIAYRSCKTGTFLIAESVYTALGPATDCCRWSVVADPRLPSGQIEIANCDYNMTYGIRGEGIINPTPTCNCDLIVLTEDTTWGGVKALYAE